MIPLRTCISFALDEAVDFEEPCEFAFASRQIEIERTRAELGRSTIDNLVNTTDQWTNRPEVGKVPTTDPTARPTARPTANPTKYFIVISSRVSLT
jgi:hypothetical protein